MLAEAIDTMTPVAIMKQMKQGFVHNNGTFLNREQATEMVGKKGDVLYSEDLLADLAKVRIVSKDVAAKDQAAVDKVTQAISKPTLKNKLAAKLMARHDSQVSVVPNIDTIAGFNDEVKDAFKGYRGVYVTSKNWLYLNATTLSKYSDKDIQATYLHEALHATIDNTFRKVSPDAYRRGMRSIQDWHNFAGIYLTQTAIKSQPLRVKAFASAMNMAAANADKAQADLDAGKGSVKKL
ncbi:unnamed protein product, partial [marine sediment metagenome]